MYARMYPGMIHWWRMRHHGHGHDFGGHDHADHGCGAHAEHGDGHDERRHERHGRGRRERFREHFMGSHHHHDDLGANAFGVRRPLRFLAFKLDLDERQVGELARILDELKTERAQAEVDGRRAMAAFADAVSGEAFDAERATGGGAIRVTTAEHLRDAVTTALGKLHALLDPQQRERLAYLIRTGTLQM